MRQTSHSHACNRLLHIILMEGVNTHWGNFQCQSLFSLSSPKEVLYTTQPNQWVKSIHSFFHSIKFRAGAYPSCLRRRGTLGLDRFPVCHRPNSRLLTFTPVSNLDLPVDPNNWMSLDCERSQREPTQAQGDAHANSTKKGPGIELRTVLMWGTSESGENKK